MNKVYAIMGPPASGKTSIIKGLLQYGIPEMISHTTRTANANEQDGVDYYFVSKEKFMQTELIERVGYDNHFYGLSKAEVLSKANQHAISVVAVNKEGLEQLHKLLRDRVQSIFIMVGEEAIIERAIARQDNAESIRRRIEYARHAGEFDNWQIADYVVKNAGSLEVATSQVLAIMGLATCTAGATRG
ncbi:MAG: guanylate kinase [Negativicutes bacterium]|nr:guanylate kinase [Negativicutes bacterium]